VPPSDRRKAIVTTRDQVIPAPVGNTIPFANGSTRFICGAFLFVLASTLILVLVQTVFFPFEPTTLNERRDPTPLPALALLLERPAQFAERINRWFDDRVGFRDFLIRAKNQIDFSVFGISRKVYIGSDGWLFERETTDARFFLERLSEPAFLRIEHSFVQFAELLKRRDIKLVVVGYPDKSTLYPNYLPASVPQLPSAGKYDRFRRFMGKQRDIIFIDAESILRAAQHNQSLYYKTDIHPTIRGSIPVVEEIVRRISASAGRGDVKWHERFAWRRIFWDQGAEARFLAVLSDVGESVDYAPDFYAVGKNPAAGHWNTDPRRIDVPGLGRLPIFDWEFVSDPTACAHLLPGAVLFGNSFSDGYTTLGLYSYFCFLRRSRTPVARLAPYVADIPKGTKYFIFQYTAPYLQSEVPSLGTAGAAPDPRQFWGATTHD
jgi:SGNH hydrolase-like domain, acetyltransferase AlgX